MKAIMYDKKMHFVAGFIIALIALAITAFMWWLFESNTLIIKLGVTIAPILAGIAKEFWDMHKPNNKFDAIDMLFTWMGGAVIFIPVWFIN